MFDVIMMNPPYKGQSRLHQQFFNKAVELTAAKGCVASLQPSTVYFNKDEQLEINRVIPEYYDKKFG